MTEKIRVAHVITRMELGGAQKNTLYTYEHLDEQGFEAYLLSGPGGILDDRVQKRARFVIIPHLGRRIDPVKDARAFFQLRRVFKRIKPHIVHTHSSKAGILGRLAAFCLPKTTRPVIIHSVHGFSFSPYQPFLVRTFYTWAERLVSRLTDHFIFVARDDLEQARQKRLVRDNGSIIRSGFPLRTFTGKSGDEAALRREYGIGEWDFVCGVIAPFKPQKGLFHLVDIAARVIGQNPRVIFFLAGDGEQREALEAELKKRGIQAHFRLPGFIFAIEKVMDIFDIGVSTALWEGLPQSLVQLRLKKKPVVASLIPGNREVIRGNENGFLVDLQDHPGFAEKILFLAGNEAERKRLAECTDDFSDWEADTMVGYQEQLYRDLLK